MEMIPLAIPNLCGNELKYLSECIETNFVSSVGAFVSRFEEEFAKYLGAKRAVAVVNGTAALHLSLLLLGVEPEDEVIVPNLTFVAPVNAIKYANAHPVFVDSTEIDFGIDAEKLSVFLEENYEIKEHYSINKQTGRKLRVVIPMHTLGMSVDFAPLEKVCQKYKLEILEDASEALGARYEGKSIGTLGKIGCFSFNGNKIITSGGGGMIVTDDISLADRAKHLSTTAKTDGIQFVHNEVGYNYRMVNLLAAVGLAQFENIDKFLSIKKKNAYFYRDHLKNISGIEFHMPIREEQSNFWFYSVLVKSQKMSRDQILEKLLAEKIQVRPIWTLMEDLPMYKDCLKTNTDTSKKIRERVINIPCSTNISEEEMLRVCDAFKRLGL